MTHNAIAEREYAKDAKALERPGWRRLFASSRRLLDEAEVRYGRQSC